MALTGNEILYVNGIAQNGMPAATLEPTTTAAIAALAATEETSLITTPITTVGNGVLTGAGLVGGQIVRTGPVGNYTDTTDTAGGIIAALPGVIVGGTFIIRIKNATAFTETLAAGTGVTLPPTLLIPAFSVGMYYATVNSATAVTLTHMGTLPIATGSSLTVPTITALSTVGAGTITAAGFNSGYTSRTGSQSGTPFTDTTDIAANIIAGNAAVINKIGAAFAYVYANNTNAPATITGGTGVTVSVITVVPAGAVAEYIVTYTAAATLTMVGFRLSSATVNSVSPVTVGSATTLTAANAGATILLNTAAGSTATLPAATGTGNIYRFVVTTTASSNAHKILAASSSDFLNGVAVGHVSAGTTLSFSAAAATAHSVQMPFAGTQPSGGFIGDWFDFTDAATNLWTVKGMYQSGTTSTTPFSASTT